MIRVDEADEPDIFEDRVRLPGNAFLNASPPGAKIDFKNREYWRRVLDEMHESYRGICAYTCHYIPYDVGANTVEHFIPRDVDPFLAYEWSNYRFVCSRMNGRKSNFTDVIDPFVVPDGMFELDFPSLQLRVGTALGRTASKLARTTIIRLGLNLERSVKSREKYVVNYRDAEITQAYLARHAPFIYSELQRQDISQGDLAEIMLDPA